MGDMRRKLENCKLSLFNANASESDYECDQEARTIVRCFIVNSNAMSNEYVHDVFSYREILPNSRIIRSTCMRFDEIESSCAYLNESHR